MKEACDSNGQQWDDLQRHRPTNLTSQSVEAFTQGADTILANWDLVIQRYTEFRQQTTTSILELEPLFGTEELQGQERATRTNAMLQARIETEEVPILQASIEIVEVTTQ